MRLDEFNGILNESRRPDFPRVIQLITETIPEAIEVWQYGKHVTGTAKPGDAWQFIVVIPDELSAAEGAEILQRTSKLRNALPGFSLQVTVCRDRMRLRDITPLYWAARGEGRKLWSNRKHALTNELRAVNEGKVEDVDTPDGMTVRVYENPVFEQALTLARECLRKRGSVNVRGIIRDGRVYVWDSWVACHDEVYEGLFPGQDDVYEAFEVFQNGREISLHPYTGKNIGNDIIRTVMRACEQIREQFA